jgi:hypothetical protein
MRLPVLWLSLGAASIAPSGRLLALAGLAFVAAVDFGSLLV